MVAGLAAVLQTSGCVVSAGIGGVGQLLPEAPVNVLLHKGVDEKTGESVQSHYRLHEEKTLHLPQLDYCLKDGKQHGNMFSSHIHIIPQC